MVDIENLCYELYKDKWIREHIKEEQMHSTIVQYYVTLDYNNTEREDYTLNDFIEEFGFAYGSMYCSFFEFIDNEYQDEQYIKELLNDSDLFTQYKKGR